MFALKRCEPLEINPLHQGDRHIGTSFTSFTCFATSATIVGHIAGWLPRMCRDHGEVLLSGERSFTPGWHPTELYCIVLSSVGWHSTQLFLTELSWTSTHCTMWLNIGTVSVALYLHIKRFSSLLHIMFQIALLFNTRQKRTLAPHLTLSLWDGERGHQRNWKPPPPSKD